MAATVTTLTERDLEPLRNKERIVGTPWYNEDVGPILLNLFATIRNMLRSVSEYLISRDKRFKQEWAIAASLPPSDAQKGEAGIALLPVFVLGTIPKAVNTNTPVRRIRYPRATFRRPAKYPTPSPPVVEVVVLLRRAGITVAEFKAGGVTPPQWVRGFQDKAAVANQGEWLRTFPHVLADVLCSFLATVTPSLLAVHNLEMDSIPFLAEDELIAFGSQLQLPAERMDKFNSRHTWTAAEARLIWPTLSLAQQRMATFFSHIFEEWYRDGGGRDFLHQVSASIVQRPGLRELFAHWLITDLKIRHDGESRLLGELPLGHALDAGQMIPWVYVRGRQDLNNLWLFNGSLSLDNVEEFAEQYETLYRRVNVAVKMFNYTQ
jgi:hypothetical protein